MSVLLSAVALLALPGAARAATITVNEASDNAALPLGGMGLCTFRDAIISAENDAAVTGSTCAPGSGADVINFNMTSDLSSGFVELDSQAPNIASAVTISGPGASLLSIHHHLAPSTPYRLLRVLGTSANLTVTGVSIEGGALVDDYGAGVENDDGHLQIDQVTLLNNQDSTTGSNGGGGAIATGGAGAVTTIDRTQIHDNSASAGSSGSLSKNGGSAVWNSQGTTTIDRSYIHDNTVAVVGGASTTAESVQGAIWNDSATLTVRRSTVSANTSTATTPGAVALHISAVDGAGISGQAGNLTIDRSTVYGNSASDDATADTTVRSTGGVFAVGASYVVKGSTIAHNTNNDPDHGANLEGAATVSDTLIAESQGVGTNCPAPSGITSLGHNLEDLSDSMTGTCGFTQSTDLHTDPMLDPSGPVVQGGSTPTVALLTGSPAIDKGLSSSGETTDQRGTGFYRPLDFFSIANASGGNGTDIGAFEVQATSPPGTKITSHSKHRTHSHHATVHFTNTSIGPATFQCRINHEGWKSCHSAKRFHLRVGTNTFRVRAIVAGMKDATPATMTFKRLG